MLAFVIYESYDVTVGEILCIWLAL